MMAFALDRPSEVTGLRRACFELCIGISAAKCFEDMQKAIIGHACRAVALRLVLELGQTFEGASQFHSGGKLNS